MTDSDPTRIRAQRALQGGSRRRWLIPGGILAAIALALFVGMLQLQLLVPTIAIVLVLVLFGAMVAVAAVVADIRARNRTMAWLMGAMAVASLVCALVVMAGEWSAVV